MIEKIIDNFSFIVASLSTLVLIGIFIKKFISAPSEQQIKKVKEWLLYAVLLAEKEYGSQTGEIKLRYVYDLFVNKFTWLAKIISFDTFSEWVDIVLEQMEELLQNNKEISNILKK